MLRVLYHKEWGIMTLFDFPTFGQNCLKLDINLQLSKDTKKQSFQSRIRHTVKVLSVAPLLCNKMHLEGTHEEFFHEH